MARLQLREKVGLADVDDSSAAAIGRNEGIEFGGVHLLRFAAEMNFVVQNHERPEVDGFRISRECHRVVKIHRSIRTDGCRWPHGTDEHDRFIAFYDETEKVCGL